MKILVVSASFIEIKEILDNLHIKMYDGKIDQYRDQHHSMDFMVTGMGVVPTTFYVHQAVFNTKYDMIIHVGIAGAFDGTLNIGDVVEIVEDGFADMGVFREGKFISLFEAGMHDPNEKPYNNGRLINCFDIPFKLPTVIKKVKGITVNQPSLAKEKIKEVKLKYNAAIETMESAAFFYVCLMEQMPFLSLRSISNKVGEESTKWNIPKAVSGLTDAFVSIMNEFK